MRGRKMECATVAACAALGWVLAGCQSQATTNPTNDASLGLVEADDWFVDDDGSVLLVQAEAKNVTAQQSEAFSVACKSMTIVGVDILSDGRIGAFMIDGNPLGLAPGQWFTCGSVEFDQATGKVYVEAGDEKLACCQMKVEQLDGVTRLSCSGTCDDGSSCSIETGEGGTLVFTCGCPANP